MRTHRMVKPGILAELQEIPESRERTDYISALSTVCKHTQTSQTRVLFMLLTQSETWDITDIMHA